jgi:hypothetical protein
LGFRSLNKNFSLRQIAEDCRGAVRAYVKQISHGAVCHLLILTDVFDDLPIDLVRGAPLVADSTA